MLSIQKLSIHKRRTGCAWLLGLVLSVTSAAGVGSPRLEAGFSPDGSARKLVLRVIDNAQQSLIAMAYVFTSRDVSDALIRAHKRGVKVRLLIDAKANFGESGRRAASRHRQYQHSMRVLEHCRKAGISIRSVRLRRGIAHDKFIVADERHVQTGSFNYTQSAARRNTENVLVAWNAPKLTSRYIEHWRKYWRRGKAF